MRRGQHRHALMIQTFVDAWPVQNRLHRRMFGLLDGQFERLCIMRSLSAVGEQQHPVAVAAHQRHSAARRQTFAGQDQRKKIAMGVDVQDDYGDRHAMRRLLIPNNPDIGQMGRALAALLEINQRRIPLADCLLERRLQTGSWVVA